MSAPSTNISKRLHVSFAPSVPSNGSEELAKSLKAHFSKFGTVKSIDGLGKLDGVGMPRKFGYINIEGPEASITKCVNSLSGSIWKGVKVRVGDARPDFQQKIAQENAQEPSPLRRKRKRGNVLAEDMSLVTPENAASRRGWKVSEMGRITHPVRMRPGHPLPPPLASAVSKSKSKSSKDKPVKPKKRRDPDIRARRRTIDMARWGSVHLSGMFLENAGQELPHDQEVEEDNTAESDSEAVPAPVAKSPPPIAKAATRPVPPPAPSLPQTASPPPDVVDLIQEKTQTLSLLQSLFGNAGDDQWQGRESVDSDLDEEALLKIGGPMITGAQDGDDDIEFVPMDVDGALDLSGPVPEEEDEAPDVPAPAPPPKKAPAKTTKLKDLFVSREEETGFSLLDHLDLELDEEFTHVVPSAAAAAEPEPEPSVAPMTTTTFVSPSSHAPVTLDPKQPLFFPLLTSFAFASAEAGGGGGFSTKARQRDVLDVGKDNGWNAHFYRSETDEEIRKKWEAEKVDLTRDWNRRWREAGKVRRRRGGGDGD